jgi:hypothetical protein
VRRVVLESRYTGDVETNVAYARACLRDCLARGEAPIASHLLFTQPGVLDDGNADERAQGIAAGTAWIPVADAVVAYTDHGISAGMWDAIRAAGLRGIAVEYRKLPDQGSANS